MLSTIVNQFVEFRMTTNKECRLGFWEVINPMYTVLNPNTETFSSIWTKYDSCFSLFYKAYLEDTTKYTDDVLFPQDFTPSNTFNISSVPWLDFTAFNINVYTNASYLLPIFTIGKYKIEKGKILMPLAIQCHHAVCDGYHVGNFVVALRKMAANPQQWL